jgi:transposase
MGNEGTPGKKARAVRLVSQLRGELGSARGTIRRIADQIGFGVESLWTWPSRPTSMTALSRG